MTKAEILKLAKDLQLTDGDELIALLDDIIKMYKFTWRTEALRLFDLIRSRRKPKPIELVEAK